MPDGLDWETWRIVASERFTVSLVELETMWSWDDVMDAHRVLDLYAELDAKSSPKAGA